MKPDNFLGAEALIVARLKAVLSTDVHVLSASDLAKIVGAQQPTPAVHVVYGGYAVEDGKVPALVRTSQEWITVVVTRNVADIEQGFHARQAAGPLACQVIDALHRHTLKEESGEPLGAGPMRLTAAPTPGFDDGHFYLPLAWLCPINFVSETCAA